MVINSVYHQPRAGGGISYSFSHGIRLVYLNHFEDRKYCQYGLYYDNPNWRNREVNSLIFTNIYFKHFWKVTDGFHSIISRTSSYSNCAVYNRYNRVSCCSIYSNLNYHSLKSGSIKHITYRYSFSMVMVAWWLRFTVLFNIHTIIGNDYVIILVVN